MASSGAVKEECFRPMQFPVKVEPEFHAANCSGNEAPVVEISSSSSSGGGDARRSHGSISNTAGEVTSSPISKRSSVLLNQTTESGGPSAKRPRLETLLDSQSSPTCSLPHDFLQPLVEVRQNSPAPRPAMAPPPSVPRPTTQNTVNKPFRQFWKAGDYESDKTGHKSTSSGMDHVRVHPKFLHSNATSHKWALGAVAELLDNALDEVVHGATFVQVDMIRNPKNREPMLIIEDDGGGMNPDSMRQCMSLGYSAKSKIANTIGQYGNGFKTSTMRLGADVVVFSRCQDNKGLGPTESIGLLSYTFLRETGQEDIIVPMIDYEIQPFGLRKLIRSNVEDWNRNMESIKRWSPYATEAELMDQFRGMKKQGTKIMIFNLWEDDQGQLELDFDTNRDDIQLRGVNRDEKCISMAERFPNSRHYLTYQHSLRIYASILYLKLPPGFKMFLRGKEIEHHNLVDDLMFTEVWTYKPVASDVQRDTGQMRAVVTVGFVKDAKEHIDVQGFNVYHKNRLIKPFWRLWNSAASRGRGIIGVLEANFVEPAHDKQGFERTIVLARLEARLIEMQKTYWSKHCHKVGYVNIALRGKEGKAAGSKGASSAGEPMQSAPSSLAPPARPSTPEAPRPAMRAGGANVPKPAGLTRTQQLQAQVHLARPVKEFNQHIVRRLSAQSIPTQSAAVGVSPQRHVPTGSSAAPVNPSSSHMVNTQPLFQLPRHSHNVTTSLLPSPASGRVPISQPLPPPASGRVPISQPETVRRVTPITSAQANHVSPTVRPIQSNFSNIGPILAQSPPAWRSPTSVGDGEALRPGLNLAQNPPVRPTSIGDARAQPPGHGVETFTPFAAAQANHVSPAVQPIQSNSSNIGPNSAQSLSVRSPTSVGDGGALPPGLNLAQNPPVRSPTSIGDARAQAPGPGVEAFTQFADAQGLSVRSPTSVGDARAQPPGPGVETFTPFADAQADHILPDVQSIQSSLSNIGPNLAQGLSVRCPTLVGDGRALPSGLNLAQNLPVRSPPTSTGDARAQPPSPGVETYRPASGSPQSILRENIAAQSFTTSPSTGGVDSHASECSNSSMTHVLPAVLSKQDAPMVAMPAVEESNSPSAVEENNSPSAGMCVAESKEQQVDVQNRQNGQVLPNLISCSAPITQENVKGSVEALTEGKRHSVEDASSPIPGHFSGPVPHVSAEDACAPIPAHFPHASAAMETNVAQIVHLPPEQGPSKVSRLTHKESMLGRKSLEELGRMFAKQAASLTMNEGEQRKILKVPEGVCTEGDVNIRSIVTSGTDKELEAQHESAMNVRAIVRSSTNTELETHLVELEAEMRHLQERLDALKAERDSLRHQLLTERLRGQLSKQELQRKVEQTWAKVRELEEKNGRMQLVQQGSAD